MSLSKSLYRKAVTTYIWWSYKSCKATVESRIRTEENFTTAAKVAL